MYNRINLCTSEQNSQSEYMNDEIIQENTFPDPIQEETIQAHCSGIEEKIRSAPSEAKARGIIETTCQAFESECESHTVKSTLLRYLFSLLRKYWRSDSLA